MTQMTFGVEKTVEKCPLCQAVHFAKIRQLRSSFNPVPPLWLFSRMCWLKIRQCSAPQIKSHHVFGSTTNHNQNISQLTTTGFSFVSFSSFFGYPVSSHASCWQRLMKCPDRTNLEALRLARTIAPAGSSHNSFGVWTQKYIRDHCFTSCHAI